MREASQALALVLNADADMLSFPSFKSRSPDAPQSRLVFARCGGAPGAGLRGRTPNRKNVRCEAWRRL